MHKIPTSLMCILAAAGAAALAFPPQGESAAPIAVSDGEPVLLELFTSQGCSSCPPADRLAARLDQETGLVVVSRPVTYWDRLGWKDTLASEDNTTLQRQYARKGLSGHNGVYTPQMVVDGTIGVVGSQERAVKQSINAARQADSAAIRAKRNSDGSAAVGLGGKAERLAELVLLKIASRADVAIGRGENAGRKITYVNVLRSERVLGSWEGGALSMRIEPSTLQGDNADRFALVLREPDAGKVLAASWIS